MTGKKFSWHDVFSKDMDGCSLDSILGIGSQGGFPSLVNSIYIENYFQYKEDGAVTHFLGLPSCLLIGPVPETHLNLKRQLHTHLPKLLLFQ